MKPNRWNQWVFMVGLLVAGATKSVAQYEQKPASELDRLPIWYPIFRPASPELQGDYPGSPNAYASFSDLVRKVSAGGKVESLSIDNRVWRQGDLTGLGQLKTVRVLYVNGLTAQQSDSLFQIVQGWPTLERLRIDLYSPDYDQAKPVRLIRLPVGLRQLPKLREVSLSGSLDWNESLQTLAGLKTLRRLDVSAWQSINTQIPDLSRLHQVTALNVKGQGWEIKPGTFDQMSQLTELSLAGVRIDTASFQQTLNGLPHLETLALENITALPRLTLGGLKSLKSVILSNNPNLVVSAALLAGLSNLDRLVIRSNRDVDLSGLCSLANLRVLLLSGDGKKATPMPNCIGQLGQLTELRLENLMLDQLPATIGSLTHLKHLTVSFCGLQSLPVLFDQLTALEQLHLDGNKLGQLPPMGQLRALGQLSVSNNQLTALPDDIGQLTQLTVLQADQNKLAQLPASLGRLINLRSLSLNNNQLEQLPDQLGKLRSLKNLSVSSNRLTALPNSIGQLDSLHYLWIGENRLRSLPNSLSQLGNLKTLSIGANELTALPTDIGRLRQLTELVIQQNPITELPASVCALQHLQSLRLSGTRLRLLPDNIGALTKLRYVSLTNNELIALPNSIGLWKDVTSLSLEQNKLEGLPNAIGRLSKLSTLTISGKDKVMEGSTGGLQQLPDSIVYCAHLSQLTIRQQPQLDADDVFTKTARMKGLTNLTIANCNVSRLPNVAWKEVAWQTVDVSQNLLTELPVGLLDAPKLQVVIAAENRLPEPLNSAFRDKDALRVAFVETGAIPVESISKPNRRVMTAYQQMAVQKARQRDWVGALSDWQKAIDYASDTVRAIPYAQRAGFHFFRKEYPEALTDFDKAIQYAPQLRKDKSPDTLAANRMLTSCWQQKAAIFGLTGQYDAALVAITQAKSFLPPSDNSPLSGLIYTERGRYLFMKDKIVEADSSYRQAIRAYEKLPYAEPGIHLTIVELSLLTGQYDRAQRAITNLPAEQLRNGYEVLKEYLETCLAVLKEANSGAQAMEHLTAYLAKHPAKVFGWSFDLFDNWLNKSKLPAEKVTALRQLTDATKERLVKPQ